MIHSTDRPSVAVALENVSLAFDGQPVLEHVDLRVARGEFLALIGPNGGGKTTLLEVILGLLRPDSGRVWIFGESPRNARGRIGYVPQHARFDRQFPICVLDVVRAGCLANRLRLPADADARARATLAKLEIEDLAGRGIGELSGGQLQRVLIARALATDPELLLFDEPTASLDLHSSQGFYELLSDLAAHMTVILSTHDITGVSAHVRSIACLNRRLYLHPSSELPAETLAEVYGCPVELIAHGLPHRVLREHEDG